MFSRFRVVLALALLIGVAVVLPVARAGNGPIQIFLEDPPNGAEALVAAVDKPGPSLLDVSLAGAETTLEPIAAAILAPASPTSAATLSFVVTFDRSVTGLEAADFRLGGTAPGCLIGAPAGAEAAYTVPLTGCSEGTVDLTLAADSIHEGGSGPEVDVTSAGVTIDRTAPTVADVLLSAAVVEAGSMVTVTATAVDDVGIASARKRLGTGPWLTASDVDDGFGGTVEALSGTFVAPNTVGTQTVCIEATDTAGNASDGTACASFTVTNASAEAPSSALAGGTLAAPTPTTGLLQAS